MFEPATCRGSGVGDWYQNLLSADTLSGNHYGW